MHNNLEYSRLGLAVPKKVLRRAHQRNALKRQIRETFRQHLTAPGLDIVVLARSHANTMTQSEWRENLMSLWHRVNTR